MVKSTKTIVALFFSVCMITVNVLAQRKMDSILVKVYPTKKTGALISLPDDYQKGKKDYPLIICFHGKSKAGHDLSKLYLEGIPYWISNGEKIEAVNPVDGKLYKFIVVAPQAENWALRPNQIQRLLDDLESNYRIDRSRIYITGYSAGGWATVMAMTDNAELSNRITAAVPMSVATIDVPNMKRFKLVADAKIATWYMAGTDEPHFLQECEKYKDSTNTYAPNLAKLTILDGFTHHSWKALYDTRNKQYGMNIYEWMLQYKK